MTNYESYINYLKAERKSENTIKNYSKYVKEFLEYAQKNENEITKQDLINYKGSLTDYSLASIGLRVNAVNSYFKYLNKVDAIETNPAIDFNAPKVKNKVKPYITKEEIRALVDNAYSARDKAVIATVATTGMRMEEMSSITMTQWNEMKEYGSRNITIIGKGDKERVIYINDLAMSYIEAYLAKKRENSVYLFESHRGNKLDDANLNRMLKNSAKKAGLRYWKEISMHYLRVAFATTANDNGIDTPTISAALGHASLATTTRYIKTNQNKIDNAMNTVTF